MMKTDWYVVLGNKFVDLVELGALFA